MRRRTPAFASLVSAAAVATGLAATAQQSTATPTASRLCRTAGIGFAGPLTGGAAFLGNEQRNWVRLFISYWNGGRAIPGVPATLKRVKIKALDGDSRLDPQVAATVAARMVSNKSILGMVGFAGSNENLGGGPVLNRARLVYVTGSATADKLTAGTSLGKGNFFRVVPNNSMQAAVGVDYMFSRLGLKQGQRVMVVDDAEAYGIGIADAAQKRFKERGVTVDRRSQGQKNTDYSSLAQKAVAEDAAAVYAPNQVASDSQLFAEQLKAAGYDGIFFGTDGSFDDTSFKFPGAYVSFFATDVYQVRVAKRITADFSRRFGRTTPFGVPSWVAAQVIAEAISKSCSDGKTSRAEVRRLVPRIVLRTSILGHPVRFNARGDLVTGLPADGVTIFKIQAGGKYKLVYG